ncbi:hypothetical protein HG535_0E01520 [Zygotorulaspora mrakii]|uniref:Chromosome transmission fidelity protein 8 n=1 Tax=Zygotorulaspora mrakii TaxID=42260 RepID=A0A7H9B342_ZYGMR|nr:uncharacterized protein HG535_0E01520 [Zygotorulaspora mrakii]QLG73068.1 hypothetical protein HG535_0E01520 [Zygotorulaspora mrakii]
MPSVTISTAQIRSLLQSKEKCASVMTPMGNMMLEIQGDLDIPSVPGDDDRFSRYDDIDIVRLGLLHINTDVKTATLFVGKKQRLLGKIVELENPLGLLKFDHENGTVEMQDLFRYKILFSNRPLPVM